MGFYRLTFLIWTFVRFFLLYIWFKSTLNCVLNGKNRFFQSQVLLGFSLIFRFEGNWLWLQFYRTWSHVIGHWIVSYESSDSQLEGAEGVEPIKPLVESEPLGLLWSVSEIEDFRNREKKHNHFYINLFLRNGNFNPHEILIINIFQIIDMVPEIFNFTNRPK